MRRSGLLIGLLLGTGLVLVVVRRELARSAAETGARAESGEESAHPGRAVPLTAPGFPARPVELVDEPEEEQESRVPAHLDDDGRLQIRGSVDTGGGIPSAESVRVIAEAYLGQTNSGRVKQLETAVAMDGSFSLSVPAGTRYAMLDLDARFLHLRTAVKALPGDEDVVLRPEVYGMIAGQALPPDGRSIPGEDVTWDDVRVRCTERGPLDLVGREKGFELDCFPDERGSFELWFVPVGMPLELVVENPFGPAWRGELEPLGPAEQRAVEVLLDPGISIAGTVIDEVCARSPGELLFVLGPAARISGRVLDARGDPVAGASVTEKIAFATGFGYITSDSSETDADGRFEHELRAAETRLYAVKDGHPPSEPVELQVGPGEDIDGLVLRLQESCRVEGRVLDEHGSPVPGAEVQVQGHYVNGVETDAEGWFAIDGLAPGHGTLSAFTGEGMTRSQADLVPGRPCTVELRFAKDDPVRLRGRLTRNGSPVKGGIALYSDRAGIEFATGPDGTFDVTLSNPGNWLGIAHAGEAVVSFEDLGQLDLRRLELTIPDVEEHELEIALESLPHIRSLEELWR